MRKIVKRVLLVVALAVLTAFSVAAVNVQAYPKPMGVTSSNTVDGHVLVRWNDDGAPIHRVGWTQETDLRAAQAAGDWLEAFHFADTTRPSNYTVKYLPHGQLYWFIVGAGGERFGQVTWSDWTSLVTGFGTGDERPTTTPTPVPEPQPDYQAGMRLVVLANSFGDEVWDPKFRRSYEHLWHFPLHSHMIATDDQLNYANDGLATHWSLSPDGNSISWTIRNDAAFHNGDPVTAEDVAWSLRYIYDDAPRSSPRLQFWRMIASTEPDRSYQYDNTHRVKEGHARVTSANQVSITFKSPAMSFLSSVSEVDGGTGGSIMSKSYFESLGSSEKDRSDGLIANPNPGAAGPFDLVSFDSGTRIVYAKRDSHFIFDTRPYPFDELEINLVRESARRNAALLSGEADISQVYVYSREHLEDAGLQYRFAPESTPIWINAWNCSIDSPQNLGHDVTRDRDISGNYSGPARGTPLMCQDKRVRQALDYAIDKRAIQELAGGPDAFHIAGTPAVTPSGIGYKADGTLDPYPFDPPKARALFVEAGYNVPAVDTYALTADAVTNLNRPVTPGGSHAWDVWTFPTGAVPNMLQIVDAVCDDWETYLGLNCRIIVSEGAAIRSWQHNGEIPGQYVIRSGSNIHDGGPRLVDQYGNPEGSQISYDPLVEPLVATAVSSTTPEAQRQNYYRAFSQAHEAHWDFTLGNVSNSYSIGTRIADWRPRPLRKSPSALWTVRWK